MNQNFFNGFRDTTDPSAKKARKNPQSVNKGKNVQNSQYETQRIFEEKYNKIVKDMIARLKDKNISFFPDRLYRHNTDKVNEALKNIQMEGVKTWEGFVRSKSGFSMSDGQIFFRHGELDTRFEGEIQVTKVERNVVCQCGKYHDC